MLLPLLMSSDSLMMRRRAVVLGAPAAFVALSPLPAVATGLTNPKDKLAFDYAPSSTGVKWSTSLLPPPSLPPYPPPHPSPPPRPDRAFPRADEC